MARGTARLLLSCVATVLAVAPAFAGPLQELIDATPEGGVARPPAGIYEERIVISKSIELDGSNGVVIDGGGKGTVFELAADKSTIRNLTIRNSGRLHNALDAGLRVKGDFNVIKDVHIEDSLFGLDLHEADNNVIRRTTITSKDMPLELRGDSVRLWYSHDNRLEDNDVSHSRDFVVWYSHGNRLTGNRIRGNRYGIHFMYANENHMTGNEIADCVVGVFLMYSNDITVENNRLMRSWGASGMGVGFKESSGVRIANNSILGNAVGIFLDISPYDPDSLNTFEGNEISYNGTGVEFHTDWEGNLFKHNTFSSNFTQIAVRGGGTALRETWKGNYWDDFAGFDGDGDSRGDSPYEIYSYADRIWMENREANFFRGGFALEALDFIERLAPFSEPRLLLREKQPLMSPPVVAAAGKPKDALEMLLQ
ncbi:MAG: nitrous oxide reductase family maturation protein NosD [Rhizobiales bacterium]|nr:nitrous oxide reductase family maturation protein NosD [Hyphomicrobiales bacterium]